MAVALAIAPHVGVQHATHNRHHGFNLRLARGQSISIIEKPERRKSEGVYYTPTCVVNHLVKRAVGPHFQGKEPTQVQGVRVLDPACGSGSFLIQAYQYILDWYLERYSEEDPEALARNMAPLQLQWPPGNPLTGLTRFWRLLKLK